MPDTHAKLLQPSSAHRWLVCTKSAVLESEFPNETTPYAEEGTRAHSMCEYKLHQLLGEERALEVTDYDDEMDECSDMYRDIVEEEWNAAKAETPDAKLFIEQRLNLEKYVPDCFGTSDAVIVSDKLLEVIDFKYGKGVAVDAVNNPQLRLYALGAYEAMSTLFDFTTVKTLIIQPRLHSVTSETMTVEELLKWANDVVIPQASLAVKGEGEYAVGEHCRFCRAGSVCRARVEEAFSVLDKADEKPDTISDEEIPAILDKLDNAEKWIESIRAYAQTRALSGHQWEGYKLVESRTNRKIDDQIKALSILNDAGFDSEEVTNTKLKGLTELEKLVGKAKFTELMGDLVVKPKGAPTLVKESDKRPAINPLDEVFE